MLVKHVCKNGDILVFDATLLMMMYAGEGYLHILLRSHGTNPVHIKQAGEPAEIEAIYNSIQEVLS